MTTRCGSTSTSTATPRLPYLLLHLNCLQLELQRSEATRRGKFLNPPFYPRKRVSTSFVRVEGSRRRGRLKILPKTVQAKVFNISKGRSSTPTGSAFFARPKSSLRTVIFERTSRANNAVHDLLLRGNCSSASSPAPRGTPSLSPSV